jgi:hypothetical protein
MKYLLLLLLLVSCGTRKTSSEFHKFQKDSIEIESKTILKQDISLEENYMFQPFDNSKPFFVDGKKYENVIVTNSKSLGVSTQKEIYETFKIYKTFEITKTKKTQKTEYTSLFFVLCLFVFLHYKLP